ncbi:FxLYD domain-containing protein [Bryobacter aggregatus]|uniref:FxLYD domain-containing protein n=1 Tax=Bryobacter aggregatus TaxID=360054 RepID=UPI0004E25316|nr:FxLYD domain-containing protein [Bryobacter aggregatus]
MRRILLTGLLIAVFLSAQDKKPKQPELLVSQVSVRRIDDQLLAVDGSIKNTGTKTYNKLQIVFEFFAPGKQSITIQRGAPEPDTIPPGESAEFHLQLRAPARAVHVELGAEDGNGRELRVGKSGPYPVE